MILLMAFLLGLFGMEGVAYATHKWIMHGPLWILHASHHRDRQGFFEANDLFGVFFSLPSMALIARGVQGHPEFLGLGLGMAAYGAVYLFIHDMLTHKRFGSLPLPRHPYLLRLVQAHRIHHSRDEKDGTRNFGFLWAKKKPY